MKSRHDTDNKFKDQQINGNVLRQRSLIAKILKDKIKQKYAY